MSKKKKYSLLSLIIFVCFWWVFLIIHIIRKNSTTPTKKKTNNYPSNNQYQKKELLTEYEKYFYNIINNNFSNDYIVMPQVNLASVINKVKEYPKQYQNELYRNIDFGIFDKQTMQPLLLIEINDKTHEQKDRIKRDIKVKEICNKANIKLIAFYSKYENKPQYIIDRIKKELA